MSDSLVTELDLGETDSLATWRPTPRPRNVPVYTDLAAVAIKPAMR